VRRESVWITVGGIVFEEGLLPRLKLIKMSTEGSGHRVGPVEIGVTKISDGDDSGNEIATSGGWLCRDGGIDSVWGVVPATRGRIE
jgi:hypothetical protein